MTRTLIPGALAIGMAAIAIAQSPEPAPAAPAPALAAAEVKSGSSYALGYRAGANFAQQFGRFGLTAEDLEQETFMKGFMSAFLGNEPDLTQEQLQAAMMQLGDQLQAREKQLAENNLAEGNAFLEKNAKREGVITTDSGLQYEVLAKGGEESYKAPAEGEQSSKQFQVRYKGTLIDGTEFDASPEGETVPMTLQVVPGFKEALTTMPVGAKWKLFLPSDLAYGEQRRSSEIGPNSVLVFELELVKIEDAPEQPQMPFQLPQGAR